MAAESRQIGRLLREMTQHYDHYRAGAAEFARSYRKNHDPARILRQLEQSAHVTPQRVVAAA